MAQLGEGCGRARQLGLRVNAGHGLTYQNVEAVAAIPGIEELNIGHTIVARALAVGLEQAVRQMKQLISQPRREPLFGAGALFTENHKRFGNATAITDCRLLVMNREKFLFAVQESPLFAIELLASIDARLRLLKNISPA